MSCRAKVSPSHDDRVAGVVTALVADDQVGVLRQQVGELAFALVAPLGSDHNGRRHTSLRMHRENYAVSWVDLPPARPGKCSRADGGPR